MIVANLSTMTFSSGFLHLGCVVRGPENSWVRFVVVEVPVCDLDLEVLAQARDAYLDTERVAADVPGLW